MLSVDTPAVKYVVVGKFTHICSLCIFILGYTISLYSHTLTKGCNFTTVNQIKIDSNPVIQ